MMDGENGDGGAGACSTPLGRNKYEYEALQLQKFTRHTDRPDRPLSLSP